MKSSDTGVVTVRVVRPYRIGARPDHEAHGTQAGIGKRPEHVVEERPAVDRHQGLQPRLRGALLVGRQLHAMVVLAHAAAEAAGKDERAVGMSHRT